jgi:hypothetical protein
VYAGSRRAQRMASVSLTSAEVKRDEAAQALQLLALRPSSSSSSSSTHSSSPCSASSSASSSSSSSL